MLRLPYCPSGWPVSIRMRLKGDLVLVDYKYDDVDPEFTGEDLYSQDFESVTANEDIVLEGWEQVTLKGDSKMAGEKNYSSNGYAQFSANGFEGEVDTWLVSPAVAVTSKDAGLSFDIKFGYYNADCLDVLVPIHMREMVRLIWHSGLA